MQELHKSSLESVSSLSELPQVSDGQVQVKSVLLNLPGPPPVRNLSPPSNGRHARDLLTPLAFDGILWSEHLFRWMSPVPHDHTPVRQPILTSTHSLFQWVHFQSLNRKTVKPSTFTPSPVDDHSTVITFTDENIC